MYHDRTVSKLLLVASFAALASQCEIPSAPVDCQQMSSEMIQSGACDGPLGLLGSDADPYQAAMCAADMFDLEEPPDLPMVSGQSNNVGYDALCQVHGNVDGFCDLSAAIGCQG